MQAPALIQVGNVRSQLQGVTPEMRAALDAAGSYQAQEVGSSAAPHWKPPEAHVGEDYWDGRAHLIRFPQQHPGVAVFPTGLLDLVRATVHKCGAMTHVVDHRRRPDHGVPDREAIPLRDYQLQAAELFEQAGAGVLEMCPRSGKTRTALEIHRRVSRPTIWLAPTNNIVRQTVDEAERWWGRNYAVELQGSRSWEDNLATPLVVCTPNTAVDLPQHFWDTRAFFVTDEAHHQAARTYRRIAEKTHHIFYRLALSGTYFRSGTDDLALLAVLSRILYRVTAEDMVRMGWMVPAHFVYLPVSGPKPAGGGRSFVDGLGRHGLYEHGYRNALASWALGTLCAYGRKPIALVGTKAQGYAIRDGLTPHFSDDPSSDVRSVEFVSTDRQKETNRTVIRRFNEGRVRVMLGTSMIGEGTDLPACDSLVYARGGKAEVEHTQGVYRPCTSDPAGGKRGAVIVDFADRHHTTLFNHSEERLRTYYGLPTFHAHVLQDPAHFAPWLQYHRERGLI